MQFILLPIWNAPCQSSPFGKKVSSGEITPHLCVAGDRRHGPCTVWTRLAEPALCRLTRTVQRNLGVVRLLRDVVFSNVHVGAWVD